MPVKLICARSRQNVSSIWDNFNGGRRNPGKWYWDNSTTPTSKKSICSFCNTHLSASIATNLRTHKQSTHKDIVIRELKANESLEVGKCATFKFLKQDYRTVSRKNSMIRKKTYHSTKIDTAGPAASNTSRFPSPFLWESGGDDWCLSIARNFVDCHAKLFLLDLFCLFPQLLLQKNIGDGPRVVEHAHYITSWIRTGTTRSIFTQD